MKNKTIAFVCLLVAGMSGVYAQGNDFRSVKWGMSAASVKAVEKSTLSSETARRLTYDCVLADNDTKLLYIFSPTDKLVRSKYFVTPDYINMIFYIRDFKMYEELLTQKYGKPTSVTPKAINKEAIKDDEWAAYLSAGELQVEVRWENAATEIVLTLSMVGEKPAIQIDYISKKLQEVDKKDRSASALKDL